MPNFIHPTAVIGADVHIEDDVYIGAYTVIGTMPEHREFYDDIAGEKSKGVLISSGARIFEFVSVHAGTTLPTFIGKHTAIFNHTHIAHDVELGDHVTVGGHSTIAGDSIIMDYAVLGGRTTIHQKSVVGAYSILGLASTLRGCVPPGQKWIGTPARPCGLNDVGLKRRNKTIEDVIKEHGDNYMFHREKSGLWVGHTSLK